MLSKILLGVGLFAALFAMLIFSGKLPIGPTQDPTPKGEVVMWGTLPETEMNSIIQEFNPKAKTYRVTYKQVREEVFGQQLLEALASNYGPDLILAPYQIILSQSARIYPFPVASLGSQTFKSLYVDGATVLFSPQGALALPVSVEPLVLFYNRTLFAKHGIVNPPLYWDEVSAMTQVLTVKNSKGQFLESGIALGAPNTPYAKDILMSIVSQLGQVPTITDYDQLGKPYTRVTANQSATDENGPLPLVSASRFFVQFSDPTQKVYSWNEYAGKADDQFVAEKLAMYIGYSGELESLRARNPRGEFEMTRFPQSRENNTFATGMKMYALATLKTSKNPITALNVESQFAGSGISPAVASIVGGVPALRQYATTPGLDDVIAKSMLVTRGWYDSYSVQSNAYIMKMIADILYNRLGINDAVSNFVSRLQDLYTPL